MENKLRNYSDKHIIHAMMLAKENRTAFLQDDSIPTLNNLITSTIEPKTVSIYMPYCFIKDNQEIGIWPFTYDLASVYVVSLALDLNGTPSNINGLYPDQPSPIETVLTRTTNMNFNISVTPLFHNVRDNSELPLVGNGIMLYGPKDPKGLVQLHVAIIDDDSGFRKLGQILEEEARKSQISSIIDSVISLGTLASPKVLALKNTFELFFNSVIVALKNNLDDVIQDFHFSALSHQNYLSGEYLVDKYGAKLKFYVDVS